MLFPEPLEARYEVMQWLMFQMSGVGPMMGQAMFFQRIAAPKGIVDEYATKRYVEESRRLLSIVNERLSGRDYLCGDYSIADIAMFPWERAYRWGNIDIDELVNLREWFERIESRDAVQRGIRVPTGEIPIAYSSDSDLSEATRQNANKYDA
jgi:GST-like protein